MHGTLHTQIVSNLFFIFRVITACPAPEHSSGVGYRMNTKRESSNKKGTIFFNENSWRNNGIQLINVRYAWESFSLSQKLPPNKCAQKHLRQYFCRDNNPIKRARHPRDKRTNSSFSLLAIINKSYPKASCIHHSSRESAAFRAMYVWEFIAWKRVFVWASIFRAPRANWKRKAQKCERFSRNSSIGMRSERGFGNACNRNHVGLSGVYCFCSSRFVRPSIDHSATRLFTIKRFFHAPLRQSRQRAKKGHRKHLVSRWASRTALLNRLICSMPDHCSPLRHSIRDFGGRWTRSNAANLKRQSIKRFTVTYRSALEAKLTENWVKYRAHSQRHRITKNEREEEEVKSKENLARAQQLQNAMKEIQKERMKR